MVRIEALAETVGVRPACAAFAVPRSSLYAHRQPTPTGETRAAPLPPANALTAVEKTALLAELNSDRFADQTPYEIYPALLDEQRYLGSLSTMYRVLAANHAVRDRRAQVRHPVRPAPQVVATRPNQVWVWDITQLASTVKFQFFYLYLVLDLFSRFIVGWLLAERQSGDYAQQLLETSFQRYAIAPQQLTVHSDNGGPMTAKPVTWLFSELEITPSLSRPQVSNDNPHAEAGFKTLKYQPDFPDAFASFRHAQIWMRDFEHWYDYQHHHTGLGLMTPAAVHFGTAEAVWQQRQQVLSAAYAAHPERFSKGAPTPPRWPAAVWINPPQALELPGENPSNDPKLSTEVSKSP